jgi:hypothetical protein
MFLNMDWLDGKEGKAIIQQTASNVEEGMRSSSNIFAVGSHDLIILVGDQLREKLQTWLSPPDPSTNQNIARKVHHRGTATWFFQGSIFQEWKSSPSLLWIHGKRTSLCLPLLQSPIPYSLLSCAAGSGKSVLWSVIPRPCCPHRLMLLQFWHCRRYHGPTRCWNGDHGLLLL